MIMEVIRLISAFDDVLMNKNAFYLVLHDRDVCVGKTAALQQRTLERYQQMGNISLSL